MKIFKCGQRRCGHEVAAEAAPDTCPSCSCDWGNAVVVVADGKSAEEVPWAEYTIGELRKYITSWGIDVDGILSKVPKGVLVAALEAAEAESAE